MGTLKCDTCGAREDCDTFQEAISKIDHACGLHAGRPCENDGRNTMFWNDLVVPKDRTEPVPNRQESTIPKSETKPKKR